MIFNNAEIIYGYFQQKKWKTFVGDLIFYSDFDKHFFGYVSEYFQGKKLRTKIGTGLRNDCGSDSETFT